jgi:hypothetical protein
MPLNTDFAFHYSLLPHAHYFTVSAKGLTNWTYYLKIISHTSNAHFKNHYKSSSIKIHRITPVKHHCKNILDVLKTADFSITWNRPYRTNESLYLGTSIFMYLRVLVKILQLTMMGEKMYIILGKSLSQNS